MHDAPASNGTAPMPKEIDMIQVRRTARHDSLIFEVVVREGKGQTRHHVTMSRETCGRLTSGEHASERYLEAAFQFLLDREPKESILRRFDVTAISRYFPEFERGDFTLPFAVLIGFDKSLRRRTAEQREKLAFPEVEHGLLPRNPLC
jgi:hypothetical protein